MHYGAYVRACGFVFVRACACVSMYFCRGGVGQGDGPCEEHIARPGGRAPARWELALPAAPSLEPMVGEVVRVGGASPGRFAAQPPLSRAGPNKGCRQQNAAQGGETRMPWRCGTDVVDREVARIGGLGSVDSDRCTRIDGLGSMDSDR